MNILFLTFQGDIAGSTNSISYLAKGLAQRGHNIYLGCRKESLLYKMAEGTTVMRIPMVFKSRFDLQNIRHIRKIVREHNIQIINAQSSWDRYNSILSRWLYRLPVKLVHTRRQISESMGGFIQNWLYVNGTDKIVAVSNGVRNSLIKNKIPAGHIHVIYNGTPSQKYETVNGEIIRKLKAKHQVNEGDFVIGCVSRKKHQEQILEALNFVPFKSKMIFVGLDNDSDYDKYLKTIEGKHEVYFTGTIPNEQALNYYPLFTINILASTMEGLSQSLLEAMALGIPVIATDYSGNPEIIKDNINGLLFRDKDVKQLASCINTLHDRADIRNKLAKAGKITALNEFSMEKTIENYEKFFYDLIKD
jgi:L-malate glycosyltransferase